MGFFTANVDAREHDASLTVLEHRWQELQRQILRYENEIGPADSEERYTDELHALTNLHEEYRTWIDSLPTATSTADIQVGFNEETQAEVGIVH